MNAWLFVQVAGWRAIVTGLLSLVPAAFVSAQEVSSSELCLIVGAPGAPEYADRLAQAADAWTSAAQRIGSKITRIGGEARERDDRTEFQNWLSATAAPSQVPLWIVYLGHGTYDGRQARLNLVGPDVTAAELAQWMQGIDRPIIFIHGGSAAAPFLNALSTPGRILISATRSGNEANYARFGEQFAFAIADANADIDQDGQTSLLEAFVTASEKVQAFYQEHGRLATEHALLDDNGDREGTPANWFRGTRLIRQPGAGRQADGDRARLIAFVSTLTERSLSADDRVLRDRLESELAALRQRRPNPPTEAYFAELEAILRQLASLYGADS